MTLLFSKALANRSGIALLVCAITIASAGSLAAAVTHPTPGGVAIELPRPAEPYAETRARLEAEGLWGDERDRTPPADPQVGDTWLWWIWDLGGYPTATQMPCTVRGMGDHVYVVVEDSQWNVTMDQGEVDTIVEHFDNISVGNFPDQGIWDLNTGHFGDPPDFDGLERVFLLYYRFDISADGYFWIYDQYPDNTQPFHSNEADVVYLATDSGLPASNYMMAVGAHEFEHLIHFNQDQNEEIWVDEGMAELAMWLFGNPDNITAFYNNPDNSLITWNSNWADYIQTYLWTLYIYEQFGGQAAIWDVVHHPGNGMYGYEAALGGLGHDVEMEDVFGDWSCANWLDDPSVEDGRYGYIGEDLPQFYAWRTHSTFPASSGGSVQDWATDYMRLTNMDGAPIITFNGSDPHDFRVKVMATDSSLPTIVREIQLDDDEDGEYAFAEAVGYDEAVISVASVTAAGTGSYSYGVEISSTDVVGGLPTAPLLTAWPNPFNPRTSLSFNLPGAGLAELRVFDIEGRCVGTPLAERVDGGEHSLVWSAGDLPSGIYLAALSLDGRKLATRKLAIVR